MAKPKQPQKSKQKSKEFESTGIFNKEDFTRIHKIIWHYKGKSISDFLKSLLFNETTKVCENVLSYNKQHYSVMSYYGVKTYFDFALDDSMRSELFHNDPIFIIRDLEGLIGYVENAVELAARISTNGSEKEKDKKADLAKIAFQKKVQSLVG